MHLQVHGAHRPRAHRIFLLPACARGLKPFPGPASSCRSGSPGRGSLTSGLALAAPGQVIQQRAFRLGKHRTHAHAAQDAQHVSMCRVQL
eukprot:10582483-Alexandrium_andersonii.AAC.1